jgi:ABC-type nitrate/sulfonate/bicarbonate transport system substrate-binding protein
MILQPKVWLNLSGDNRDTRVRPRVSAAHNEWNHVAIALIAMEEGFFAAEGLSEVELITFPENAGKLLDREAVQVELLAQGAIDIAIDPRAAFVLEAKDKDQPVAIVAARRKNHAFIMIGERGLKTIQDLRGAVVEMNHPGGATDVMMRQVLKDSGLAPDTDVRFSYNGGAMHDVRGVIESFKRRAYGPVIMVPVGEEPALVEAGYPILADLRTLYPSRHDRVTAANEIFCRNHPDLLKGFLKGMIRGCRFVLDPGKKEKLKEVLHQAGFLNTDEERRSFEDLFNIWHERISSDLALPIDGIQLIVDEEKRAGRITPSFRTEDVLRLEALQLAQAELVA